MPASSTAETRRRRDSLILSVRPSSSSYCYKLQAVATPSDPPLHTIYSSSFGGGGPHGCSILCLRRNGSERTEVSARRWATDSLCSLLLRSAHMATDGDTRAIKAAPVARQQTRASRNESKKRNDRTHLEHLELCPSQALVVRQRDVRQQGSVSNDGRVGVAGLVREPLAAEERRISSEGREGGRRERDRLLGHVGVSWASEKRSREVSVRV